MSDRKSILPDEMRGVMHVTGARGIGKSFLLSQLDFPDNILFIDCENKGESLDKQIAFGAYHAITRGKNVSPIHVYERMQTIIDGIEKDRFTVCIIDNISWLELALRAEANRNLEKYVQDYNLNIKNVKANRFGGLSSVVNFLISDRICNPLHDKGIRLIAVSSHVKTAWGVGGPIPNKKRIKGADRWQELSVLSIILVPGKYSPTPSGLVMKEQLENITIRHPSELSDSDYELYQRGELGHSIKRRLPLKLPKATAQEIRRYLNNPADLDNPTPDEIPGDEQDEYSDKLSVEQIEYMKAAASYVEREERSSDEEYKKVMEIEASNEMNEAINVVRPLFLDGVTKIPELLPILKEAGVNISPPNLARVLSVLNKEQELDE